MSLAVLLQPVDSSGPRLKLAPERLKILKQPPPEYTAPIPSTTSWRPGNGGKQQSPCLPYDRPCSNMIFTILLALYAITSVAVMARP